MYPRPAKTRRVTPWRFKGSDSSTWGSTPSSQSASWPRTVWGWGARGLHPRRAAHPPASPWSGAMGPGRGTGSWICTQLGGALGAGARHPPPGIPWALEKTPLAPGLPAAHATSWSVKMPRGLTICLIFNLCLLFVMSNAFGGLIPCLYSSQIFSIIPSAHLRFGLPTLLVLG